MATIQQEAPALLQQVQLDQGSNEQLAWCRCGLFSASPGTLLNIAPTLAYHILLHVCCSKLPPTSYCTSCLSGTATATEYGAFLSAASSWLLCDSTAEEFCNDCLVSAGSLLGAVSTRAVWFCSNCLESAGSLLWAASASSGCASSFCCSCSCSFHCSLFFGGLRCTDRRAFLLTATVLLLLLALTGYHRPSTGERLLPACQHLNLQARTEIRQTARKRDRQTDRPDDMHKLSNCSLHKQRHTQSYCILDGMPKRSSKATGMHRSVVLYSRSPLYNHCY